jgi:hypothetical protein
MRVKLFTSLSGTEFNHAHGAIVDLPDDEAIRFIEAGMAVPVRDEEGEDMRLPMENAEFAKLSKAEIVARAAEAHGLELNPRMTKAEMCDAVVKHLEATDAGKAEE